MNNYGDFEEIKDEKEKVQTEPETPARVRMPRHGQFIGIVIQRLGGNRMSVKSTDGKTRNCRVPGRFSRRFWLRPNDAVIIQPWPDDDNKADVVHQYKGNEAFQLKKSDLLKKLKDEF